MHPVDTLYTKFNSRSTGWVIEQARTYTIAQDDGTTKEIEYTSYWYGPNHGWGNTWGASLDPERSYCVVVFETRGAALQVASDFFGPMGGKKGMRARQVKDGRLVEAN